MQAQRATIQLDHTYVYVNLALQAMALTAQVYQRFN